MIYISEVELLGRLDMGLKEKERIQGDSWVSSWNNLMAIYKVRKSGKKLVLCFKYVKCEKPARYPSRNFEWAIGNDSLDRTWKRDLS